MHNYDGIRKRDVELAANNKNDDACRREIIDTDLYFRTGEYRVIEVLDEDFKPDLTQKFGGEFVLSEEPPSKPKKKPQTKEEIAKRFHREPGQPSKYQVLKDTYSRDQMIADLKSGKSHNQIAKERNVNSSYIFKLRGEYAIEIDDLRTVKIEKSEEDTDMGIITELMEKVSREQLIIELAEGSQRIVAEKHKVGQATISQLKSRYKITSAEIAAVRHGFIVGLGNKTEEPAKVEEIEVTKTELEPSEAEVNEIWDALGEELMMELAEETQDDLSEAFEAETCSCNCKCTTEQPEGVKMTVIEASDEYFRLEEACKVMERVKDFLAQGDFNQSEEVDIVVDQCLNGWAARMDAIDYTLRNTVVVIRGKAS